MKWIDDLKARFKPKSAAEREKMKKYLIVFPLMFLSCIACIWLIFSPGGSDDKTNGGANTELPDGSSEEIQGRKITAYEAQALEDEKAQRDSQIAQLDTLVTTIAEDTVPQTDEIQSSADVYQQVQASIQDFYIPEPSAESQQVEELQARLAELEAQQTMEQPQQPNEMELLERSYQLAAQYMGNGGQAAAVIVDEPEKERKVAPVTQVERHVVSSLSSTSENVRTFATAVGQKKQGFKNTVSACIASEQSIVDGESVKLRTLEPMWIGQSLLPRNSIIVGKARVQGERLEIKIESIEASGYIFDVDLSVYDSDGQEGINIPQSLESDALHEIGANMGSTMGSTINLSTNAGAQLASDVGKGLINGVSQYLNKKLRTVKVHLKTGYKVMLKQNEK